MAGDPIHGAVAKFCERRRRIHAHVLACVLAMYELDGFSGNPGVGVWQGSIANKKGDDTNALIEEKCQNINDENGNDTGGGLENDAAHDMGGLIDYVSGLPVLAA